LVLFAKAKQQMNAMVNIFFMFLIFKPFKIISVSLSLSKAS
jgi:hypothetical protein